MTRTEPDPGSFRDPSGRIYHRDGRILRSVMPVAAESFELARESGLLDDLVARKLLLPYEPVDRALLVEVAPDAAHVLEHPRLRHVSYPYEWPFGLLKAAALAHLEVHLAALGRGLTLSDATAYNIQFRGPEPVFIDHLSFRGYREGEYWAGHRQFCEEFLNPLLLRAECGVAHNAWYRGSLGGVPVSDLARLLPMRRRLFSWNLLTHVALQARFQRTSSSAGAARATAARPLPLSAFVRMLEGLRAWIRKLTPPGGEETTWERYAEHTGYRDDAMARKLAFVESFVAARRPRLVWDVGCNTGAFSQAALASGAEAVVGFDADHGALERAVVRARREQLDLLPLYLDATNPSPDQGWNEGERRGVRSRTGADAVLALALVHHLALSGNVPLEHVVDWIVGSAPSGVIEFVPKSDPRVGELLRLREDIFGDYDGDAFVSHVAARARIVRQEALAPGGRLLIAFERS